MQALFLDYEGKLSPFECSQIRIYGVFIIGERLNENCCKRGMRVYWQHTCREASRRWILLDRFDNLSTGNLNNLKGLNVQFLNSVFMALSYC